MLYYDWSATQALNLDYISLQKNYIPRIKILLHRFTCLYQCEDKIVQTCQFKMTCKELAFPSSTQLWHLMNRMHNLERASGRGQNISRAKRMTLESNVLQVCEPTYSRIMDNPKLITLSATELFWGQNIWKGLIHISIKELLLMFQLPLANKMKRHKIQLIHSRGTIMSFEINPTASLQSH